MHPLKRLAKLRKIVEENIATAEWWADNCPEERPIDCEADRVALAKIDACIRAWGSERFSPLVDDLHAFSQAIARETDDSERKQP
jgi:hypothetical protein